MRFLKAGSRPLISSALLEVELYSYLRRLRRTTSTDGEVADYFANLISHLLFRVILRPINSTQLELAVTHLQGCQIQGRLRSLDAIHFASFYEFANRIQGTVLLSADDSLLGLARENNRATFNPLTDVVD